MSVFVMGAVFRAPLAPREKLVALALADWANDDGGSIFPAVETIAHKAGYSRRSVQYALRSLIAQGLLVACAPADPRAALHAPVTYCFQMAALHAAGGANPAPQGRKDCTPPGANIAPNPSVVSVSIEKPPPIRPPRGGNGVGPADHADPDAEPLLTFERLWEVYPRKTAKHAARRSFARLKLTPALVQALDDALTWQVEEWAKRENEFVPHLSTYLNQRRWEDLPPDKVIRQRQRRP